MDFTKPVLKPLLQLIQNFSEAHNGNWVRPVCCTYFMIIKNNGSLKNVDKTNITPSQVCYQNILADLPYSSYHRH